MNYASIFKMEEERLDKERQDKLKKYELDDESINEFRSKIKKVSECECKKLTDELFREIIFHGVNDNTNKISKLILSGADFNATYYKDGKRRPLLYWSIKYCQLSSIILLIKAGAYLKYYNVDLRPTYIELSMHYGRSQLLEILILLGVDCNSKDIYGLKPIDYAKNKECIDILKVYTTEEINPVNELLKKIKNPKEKTKKEILEDAIEEMKGAINDCSLLGEDYQKQLKK